MFFDFGNLVHNLVDFEHGGGQDVLKSQDVAGGADNTVPAVRTVRCSEIQYGAVTDSKVK